MVTHFKVSLSWVEITNSVIPDKIAMLPEEKANLGLHGVIIHTCLELFG